MRCKHSICIPVNEILTIVGCYLRGRTFGDSVGRRRIVDRSAVATKVVTASYALEILPEWRTAGSFV
jgi:hypothetical protein